MNQGDRVENAPARHSVGWGWLLPLFILSLACQLVSLPALDNSAMRLLEKRSGLIAYAGLDGNIFTIDQFGRNRRAITMDARLPAGQEVPTRFYRYPTWSPDGKQLAFVGLEGADNRGHAVGLYTAAINGQGPLEIYHSEEELPFYLYWSPDSQQVSFLTTAAGSDMALKVTPATGGETHQLALGAPFYWAWAPDNHTILIHTGGAAKFSQTARLTLLTLDEPVEERELALKPSFFQAPAWSPAGDELLLGGIGDMGEDSLVLAGRDGTVKKILGRIDGLIAFGWSPDGRRVAYVNRGPIPLQGSSRNLLTILDPADLEASIQMEERYVIAFFWSPDSRKLAYLASEVAVPGLQTSLPGQADVVLMLKLFVLDLETGLSSQLATFQPTADFTSILPYFDQYQHSATLWSPDSRYLVIAADNPGASPGIYVLNTTDDGNPIWIADGSLAFWSWR